DLGILIDSSNSIEKHGRGNFRRVLEFVKRLVSTFHVSPRRARIGLIVYSSRSYLVGGFRRYRNLRSVLQAIKRIRYIRGGTYTGKAMKYALRKLFSRRAGYHHARVRLFRSSRKGAAKILVMITDGISQDRVTTPALRLKKMGVVIFSVGVGKRYRLKQLMQIASRPRLVFTAPFRALGPLVRVLKQKACRGE
ncbi:predicted protein, partial [Nematostella vectensis]